MTLVVTPRNKHQEKALRAFMQILDISFHTAEEEDAALYNAMQIGRKTALLNAEEKTAFLNKLISATK